MLREIRYGYGNHGHTYENQRGREVDETTQVGGKQSIRIDEDNPSKIYTNGDPGKLGGIIFIVFSLTGLFTLIRRWMAEREKEQYN